MKKFFVLFICIFLLFPSVLALQEATVIIEDSEFVPPVVYFEPDEPAVLTFVNHDTIAHGFGAYDLDILGRIEANETVSFEIPTDKEGEFYYYCSIYCGDKHYGMEGVIVIGEGESESSALMAGSTTTQTLLWLILGGVLVLIFLFLIKPVRKKFRVFAYSRYFPHMFYLLALFVWIVMIVNVLGANLFSINLTMNIWWILWWPLVILSILFLGRAWCGWLCPLGAVNEYCSILPKKVKLPRPVLKVLRWSWLPFLIFILVVLAERIFGMVGVPQASGYFFLILFAGAILMGLFLRKRMWCTLVCPLGTIFGLFSKISFLHFEAKNEGREICTEKKCVQACPTFTNLHSGKSKVNCLLCFKCAKVCDDIHLKIGEPGRGLFHFWKKEESLFLITLPGLFFSIFFLNPERYAPFESWFNTYVPLQLSLNTYALGEINALVFFGAILLITLLSLGITAFLGYLSSRLSQHSFREHFFRTNYMFTPFVFFSIQVVTGEGLLALIGQEQILKILLLSIGATWSAYLGVKVLKDLKIIAKVPLFLTLGLYFFMFYIVSIL